MKLGLRRLGFGEPCVWRKPREGFREALRGNLREFKEKIDFINPFSYTDIKK